MKKLLLSLAIICGAFSINAKTTAESDTLAVVHSKIETIIEHKTQNSKGFEVVKYYFKYDDELIPTSQRVAETYKLSKQYNAKCALALVINTRTGRKRIILN